MASIQSSPARSSLPLPQELVRQVVLSDVLSRKDHRSIRQTCRNLSNSVNWIVFRRIHLSRLRRNWEKFENIANSDHLRCHVRQIVWLDVSSIPPFDRWPEYGFEDVDDLTAAGQAKVKTVRESIQSRSWLPDEMESEHGQQVINEYTTRFRRALARMPHVNTFISKPMPDDRVYTVEDQPVEKRLYWRLSGRNRPLGEGMSKFFLPAMTIPDLNITQLRWKEHFLSRDLLLSEDYCAAFKGLTSIRLHMSWTTATDTSFVPNLLNCLQEATGLCEFAVAFPHTLDCSVYRYKIGDLFTELFCQGFRWESLKSFTTANLEAPTESLVCFVELHASTLRFLSIDKLSNQDDAKLYLARFSEIQFHLSAFASEMGKAMVDEDEGA